jgi:hypothetical protein
LCGQYILENDTNIVPAVPVCLDKLSNSFAVWLNCSQSAFRFSMVSIYLAIFDRLVGGYKIYAAPAVASNLILQYLFGFAFPLVDDARKSRYTMP